jgi:DNA-directed RNA polymerase subunit F
MENLYQERQLRKKSLFQKIFGQQPKENAIIELNNLLACKSVNNIHQADIADITARYRLDLRKTYIQNLREFYAVYLNHCLNDHQLMTDERKELEHLRSVLLLSKEEAKEIHQQLAEPMYRKVFSKAVADGELSEEELQYLERLRLLLELSNEKADKISESVRSSFVKKKLYEAIDDKRLSPEEERELAIVSKNLGVELEMDTASREKLERYKQTPKSPT